MMKKGVTKKAATKKALPKKSAVKKGPKNEKKQSGIMLRPKAEEYPQESTAFVLLEDSFIVVSGTSQTVVVPAKAWYCPKKINGPRPGIDSFEYMLDYNGKQLSLVRVVVAGIDKKYEGTIQADLGGISVKGDKPLLDSLTVTVITKKKVTPPPPPPTPLSSSANELIYTADKLTAAKSKRGTKKTAK
jgi:hypothetical protein